MTSTLTSSMTCDLCPPLRCLHRRSPSPSPPLLREGVTQRHSCKSRGWLTVPQGIHHSLFSELSFPRRGLEPHQRRPNLPPEQLPPEQDEQKLRTTPSSIRAFLKDICSRTKRPGPDRGGNQRRGISSCNGIWIETVLRVKNSLDISDQWDPQ